MSPPVLLGLLNGLSDDMYTISRLGLIGRRAGERAGYYADWCWFATTLVNLVENGVERSVILEQQHQGQSDIIPILEIWRCARALLTSDRVCSGNAVVRRVDARRDGQVKSAGEPAGREGVGAPEAAGLLDRGVAPEAADGPHLCV